MMHLQCFSFTKSLNFYISLARNDFVKTHKYYCLLILFHVDTSDTTRSEEYEGLQNPESDSKELWSTGRFL